MSEKQSMFAVRVQQYTLDNAGVNIDEAVQMGSEVATWLGKRFRDQFPSLLGDEEMATILHAHKILSPVQHCKGFSKLCKLMVASEFHNHLFTASVGKWLIGQGYSVEFEPSFDSKKGPHPDIKVVAGGDIAYVECKSMHISNSEYREKAEGISELVRELIATYCEIRVILDTPMSVDDIRPILDQPHVKAMLQEPVAHPISHELTNELHVRVSPRNPAELEQECFIIAHLDGFEEDLRTGVRLPFNTIFKQNRSVTVVHPAPLLDYKFSSQKERCSNQYVDGYPFLIVVNGSNMPGNPRQHSRYIGREWCNSENYYISGVVILESDATYHWHNPHSLRRFPLVADTDVQPIIGSHSK